MARTRETMTDEQRKSVALEYLKALDNGGTTTSGGSILDLFAADAQVHFPTDSRARPRPPPPRPGPDHHRSRHVRAGPRRPLLRQVVPRLSTFRRLRVPMRAGLDGFPHGWVELGERA